MSCLVLHHAPGFIGVIPCSVPYYVSVATSFLSQEFQISGACAVGAILSAITRPWSFWTRCPGSSHAFAHRGLSWRAATALSELDSFAPLLPSSSFIRLFKFHMQPPSTSALRTKFNSYLGFNSKHFAPLTITYLIDGASSVDKLSYCQRFAFRIKLVRRSRFGHLNFLSL